MSWFELQEILRIHEVGIAASLHGMRDVLLQSMPPEYAAGLRQNSEANLQLLSDIQRLNAQIEPISDGSYPFESWLTVAVYVTRMFPSQANFFSTKLEKLKQKQAGGTNSDDDVADKDGDAPDADPAIDEAEVGDPGELEEAGEGGQARCPTKAMVITAQAPFLNRDSIRDGLRSLAEDDGAMFLIVKGLPQTGKSYIRRFLRFLARAKWLKATCVAVKYDNRLQAANQQTVAQAMSDVVVGMTNQEQHRPEPWTKEETLHQYAEKAGKWFRDYMKTKNETKYWIAPDGFDKRNLDPSVFELFKKLMSHVEESLDHVRLLFLGYYGDPPNEFELLWWYREIVAPKDEDVHHFLKHIAEHLGESDPDRFAEKWLLQIRREVPANAADRSKEIAKWCQDVARRHNVPVGV